MKDIKIIFDLTELEKKINQNILDLIELPISNLAKFKMKFTGHW